MTDLFSFSCTLLAATTIYLKRQFIQYHLWILCVQCSHFYFMWDTFLFILEICIYELLWYTNIWKVLEFRNASHCHWGAAAIDQEFPFSVSSEIKRKCKEDFWGLLLIVFDIVQCGVPLWCQPSFLYYMLWNRWFKLC